MTSQTGSMGVERFLKSLQFYFSSPFLPSFFSSNILLHFSLPTFFYICSVEKFVLKHIYLEDVMSLEKDVKNWRGKEWPEKKCLEEEMSRKRMKLRWSLQFLFPCDPVKRPKVYQSMIFKSGLTGFFVSCNRGMKKNDSWRKNRSH